MSTEEARIVPATGRATVPTASGTAAAAQAAYDVLAALYPSQVAPAVNPIKTQLNTSLSGISGTALTDGVALGHAVATQVLAARANDPTVGAQINWPGNGSSVPSAPGKWATDPLHPSQSAWGPNWGALPTFSPNAAAGNATLVANKINALVPGATSLTDATFLSSAYYKSQYDYIKDIGAATGSSRTLDQAKAGYYWAYDVGGLGPPPVLYNEILKTIAIQKGNTVQQNARLFALANMAMADAGIVAWNIKFAQDFWRPVTAIRYGDNDLNSQTVGNSSWLPLGALSQIITNAAAPPGNNDPFTPPFPAFTSGHASFGGALFQTLRDFYGTDNIGFTFTSDNLPNDPRTFNTLSAAELENGYSRLYLGIHWQFDADIGIASGDLVADHVFANSIVPTPEPSAIVLAAMGMLGLFAAARKRRQKAAP